MTFLAFRFAAFLAAAFSDRRHVRADPRPPCVRAQATRRTMRHRSFIVIVFPPGVDDATLFSFA
jgi:hypothetical protein